MGNSKPQAATNEGTMRTLPSSTKQTVIPRSQGRRRQMSLGIGPHDSDCQCERCKSRRQEFAAEIPQDDLTQAYVWATEIATRNNQTVGKDNQYFVTLQQLESIFLRIKRT
jgi:hypothetical protein